MWHLCAYYDYKVSYFNVFPVHIHFPPYFIIHCAGMNFAWEILCWYIHKPHPPGLSHHLKIPWQDHGLLNYLPRVWFVRMEGCWKGRLQEWTQEMEMTHEGLYLCSNLLENWEGGRHSLLARKLAQCWGYLNTIWSLGCDVCLIGWHFLRPWQQKTDL